MRRSQCACTQNLLFWKKRDYVLNGANQDVQVIPGFLVGSGVSGVSSGVSGVGGGHLNKPILHLIRQSLQSRAEPGQPFGVSLDVGFVL